MTRRIIRLSVADQHPGVVLLTDAVSGEKLDQCAAHIVTSILGHRKEAYYEAARIDGVWHVYEEVPGKPSEMSK